MKTKTAIKIKNEDEGTTELWDLGRIDKLFAAYQASKIAADVECALTDILTDLRHYADAKGLDFDGSLASSYNHHEAEAITKS